MKWITRARPKIDRVACPWLIARFIDKEPEFLFVPPEQVVPQTQAIGAIPTTFLLSSALTRDHFAASMHFSRNTHSLIPACRI